MTNPLKLTSYTAENKEKGQSDSACCCTHWHYGYLHHKCFTWWLFSISFNHTHLDYSFFVLLFKLGILSTLQFMVPWLGRAAFEIEIFQNWHWKSIIFLIFFLCFIFYFISSPVLFEGVERSHFISALYYVCAFFSTYLWSWDVAAHKQMRIIRKHIWQTSFLLCILTDKSFFTESLWCAIVARFLIV